MSAVHPSSGAAELASAVRKLYIQGQTDYSLEPVILADSRGCPIGRVQDGDAVIFCLRRGEREIQLTEAFVDPQVGNFPRKHFDHLPFVILTLYHEQFRDLPVAFAPSRVNHTLCEIISRSHLRQLHISESEKFSHITFFLNGGTNQRFDGETDIRIPSPREIPPEQIPQLSLGELVNRLTLELKVGYGFIVANFANGDVIGHTRCSEAKIKCASYIDSYLEQLIDSAQAENYLVIVTSDHGNLEQMFTEEGKPHVSHTSNPVPFLIIAPTSPLPIQLSSGRLADIAPTILSILGIAPPPEMTGKNLVVGNMPSGFHRVLLLILDGWGVGRDDDSNPIFLADTPCWDRLVHHHPYTRLEADGESVGLKAGKAGNSEAGHMNIGAGRVISQDDVRLDDAMQNGSFYTNEIFLHTMNQVKQDRTNLHLIGLLSERSSHGSIDYPLALLRMAKDIGLNNAYLHIIFDGRSTEPGSAPALLAKLEDKIDAIGIGKIVTGMGREFALDRDGDYAKTKRAYDALVFGIGRSYSVEW